MELDRFGNYVFILLFVVSRQPAPRVFEATIGAVLDWALGLLP